VTTSAHHVDLTGRQVRLRELRAADLPVYQRIYTHRALTRYLGVDRMDPQGAAAAFQAALDQQAASPRRRYTLAITARGDDTMFGCIGLLVEDYGRNAMITALVILPDAPISGCGPEAGRLLTAFAFGPLGLHRVWAGHRSDHRHMRALMTATGLAPESTLRQLFHTQGTWHDVDTYAALAPEWTITSQPHEQKVLALRQP
jgi:RimJ/RimL family protein N-acetyltransferase